MNIAFQQVKLILALIIFLLLESVNAQNVTIYPGDSVLLNAPNYRGNLIWQEWNYNSSTSNPVWLDIIGSENKNIWQTPLVHKQYRAKVTEANCFPVVYSNLKTVLLSSNPGFQITTDTPSIVTAETANAGGEIIRLGGNSKIIARGVSYDTVSTINTLKNKTIDSSGIGKFTSKITGLKEGTTYYYKAYYTYQLGYSVFGNLQSFKTMRGLEVTIDSAAIPTYNTGKLFGFIKLNNSDTIVERGFCWIFKNDMGSVFRDPEISDHFITAGTGPGAFSRVINLPSNTTIYYRSYAKTQKGKYFYSTVFYNNQFLPATAVLKTYKYLIPIADSVGYLSKNSARLNFAVYGDGKYSQYGICYGTTQNPTLLGPRVYQTGSFDGASNTSFLIQSLLSNTIYYARAYLVNDTGIVVYGNQVYIKTLLNTQTDAMIEAMTPTMDGNKINLDAQLYGSSSAINRGFCYRISEYPTDKYMLALGDSVINLGAGSNQFSGIPNVSKPEFYFTRAFVKLSNGTTIISGYRPFFYYNFAKTQLEIQSMLNVQTTSIDIGSFADIIPNSGSGNISARGICFSTEPNVSIDDTKINGGNQVGEKLIALTNLQPNTTYFVRAYATVNAYGSGYNTDYSDELSFKTLPAPTTSVFTDKPGKISAQSVEFIGKATGNNPIKSKGFCWNTSGTPTTSNDGVSQSGGLGEYTMQVTGLQPNTTYYVRAFVKPISGGTTYGNSETFTTPESPVIISTSTISGISTNSAMVEAELEIQAGINITAKGICYGTSSEPLVSGSKTNEGTNISNFNSALSGLTAGSQYYARAYVTLSSGITYYGNEVNFTTATSASFVCSTNTINNVGIAVESYQGTVGGTVTGTGTISSRGVCYGLTPNPMISGSKLVIGSGMGSFSANLGSLLVDKKYYYRTYATNSSGITVYGPQLSIYFASTITTTPITNIQANSASTGGFIPNPLAGTVTARGVCYSVSPNPTIANSKTTNGTGVGTFTSTLNGLTINTKYYVRAFATLSSGTTYYGNQQIFNTFQLGVLSVTTFQPTSVSNETSDVSGSVLGQGNITESGFCYGTSSNPTISGNKVKTFLWDSSVFKSQIIGLLPATIYYVRAYATEGGGTTFYGNQYSFTTQAAPNLTVITNPITNNTGFEANAGGSVSGTGTILETGICFGLTSNPVIFSNSATIPMGTTMGTFTGKIGHYLPNTNFYLRAYAKTVGGAVFYGSDVNFVTSPLLVNTHFPKEVLGITAKLSGEVLVFGSTMTVTNKGICYDTSANPTILNNKTSNGSGPGLFTVDLSGLTINTSYYYRTYATNNSGQTIYGNLRIFTTQSHASIFIDTRGIFEKTSTTAIAGGLIENIGSETITSRGVCYSLLPDPTTAGTKTSDGAGNGIFISSLGGLTASTVYYFRAYGITNTGKTVYGKTVLMSTYATDPIIPPPSSGNPAPVPPPNKGGGGSIGGPRFLVFGRVWGPAKMDCEEGSSIFSDIVAYVPQIVEGEYSYALKAQATKDLMDRMKREKKGKSYTYAVESSTDFAGGIANRHAVIIQYTKKIPAWKCKSVCVTIGYGTSYNEALNKAIARKNDDINGAKAATYAVVKHVQW